MVTTYEFAQLLPTTRKRPGGGGLLVLASANVGESLTGYLTKVNPPNFASVRRHNGWKDFSAA